MTIKKGDWVRIKVPEVYGQVVLVNADPTAPPRDQFYKIQVPQFIYKRETDLEVLPDPGPSHKENYESFQMLFEAFKQNPTFETFNVLMTAYMVVFPPPERK